MALLTKYITRAFTLLAMAALLALFPPGPTAPARAQGEPPVPSGGQVFLPFVAGGAVPDLIFTPDNVELRPGAEASISVRVEPAADLTGATFELPGVQDGVTSRFEAAPDGQSGTLTIEASGAADASERALMVRGTSGDGSKGWVGKLTVTTDPVPGGLFLFVDPVNGNNANDGSQSKPFKTLSKALSISKSGDTINLAAGSYGSFSFFSNGEIFPASGIVVPSNVRIVGALDSSGFPASFLLSSSSTSAGLILQGDAVVKNLDFRGAGFGVTVFAKQGTQTLSNIVLGVTGTSAVVDGVTLSSGIVLRGTAKAALNAGASGSNTIGSTIVVNGGFGVRVSDGAQFTMTGGKFIVGNPLAVAVSLSETARATLTSSIIRADTGNSLLLKGSAQATLRNSTIALLSDTDFGQTAITATEKAQVIVDGGSIGAGSPNCAHLAGLLLGDSAKATLKNGVTLTNLSSGALFMNGSASALFDHAKIDTTFLGPTCGNQFAIGTRDFALLTVKNSSITALDTTFFSAGISTSSFLPLTIEATTISGFSHTGIFVAGHGLVSVLNGSTLSGNKFGIDTGSNDEGNVFISNSTLIGNKTGIRADFMKLRNTKVIGNVVGVDAQGVGSDLGTLTDPGNNTFTNNNTGVTFIKSNSIVGFINAVGNTWNANVQGADSLGHYNTHLVVTPISPNPRGTNFNFQPTSTNPEDKIQL
jgi:hypothetical protein